MFDKLFLKTETKMSKGFTMMEILIVLGVIAMLSTMVVIFLKPKEFIAQSRDSERINDIRRIDTAIKLAKDSLYETLTDNTAPNIVYVSLPDTNGDNLCNEYFLPGLAGGWSYQCVAQDSELNNVDGTGWIPIDFTSVSTNPLQSLPVDPLNNETNYYIYSQSGLATPLQSVKYDDLALNDGGALGDYYETAPFTYVASGGDRYWVGGSGTWDGNSSAHWSDVSGGPGGFSVPVLNPFIEDSNRVFFDANSGGGNVLITTAGGYFARTSGFNTTGWTGTFDANSIVYVGGDITIGPGQTHNNLTINGILGPGISSIDSHWRMNGSSIYQATFGYTNDDSTATYILEDDLTTTSTVNIASSDNIGTTTLDLNGHNITSGFARRAYDGPNTPNVVINMGTGTWTLTGTGTVWDMKTPTGLTLNNGSSTIKINNSSSSSKTFAGGGSVYNNIWFSGTGTGNFILTGSNTFNDFKVDTPPHTVQFTAATNTTVNTFSVNGTSGNLITIGSVTAASHTLTKLGGGTINGDYLSISRSTATPGTTWYAGSNSIDGGNNSGWTFAGGGGTGIIFAGTDNSIYRCDTATNCDEQADWLDVTGVSWPATVDFTYDPGNNVMYAATWGEEVFRCDMSTGCDAEAEWISVFHPLSTFISSVHFDPGTSAVYAGTESSSIYRCAVSTGCDTGGEWILSVTGIYDWVSDIKSDTTNNVIYAIDHDSFVQDTSRILRCQASTSCNEATDWTVLSFASSTDFEQLAFDSANGVMYGAGYDFTGGELRRCAVSTGCDVVGEWTVTYSLAATNFVSVILTNTKLFIGEFDNISPIEPNTKSDIHSCPLSSSCDISTDFLSVYRLPSPRNNYTYAFAYDPTGDVLYAGNGEDAGIARCPLSTGCDATGDWTNIFTSADWYITSMFYKP